MVEKKIDKAQIFYYDDDNAVKKSYVIILEETANGVKFKFEDNDLTITLPWYRVLKIKRSGEEEKNA